MADPRDKLTDALAHARAMRLPLEFMQNPRAYLQLRRGLDAVEQGIREALADLPDWSVGGDAVDRRQFNNLFKLVGLAALAPIGAVDRLAAPLPTRLDDVYLRALEQVSSTYGRGSLTARPADLLPLVAAHVDRLEALQQAWMTAGQRDRLTSLTADAAAMAGWRALDAGHPGQASAWFASARRHAQHAGDDRLHALAVASQGLMHSTLPTAGLRGDTDHALWSLRQAYASVGDDPYARAWLAANIAEESAMAGDVYGYGEYLQHAAAAAAQQPREGVGFWTHVVAGLPGLLDGYAVRGRMLLGRPDVEPDLTRQLASAESRARITGLNDLGQFYATIGEPEQAARYTTEAVHLAAQLGVVRSRQRARGIRARLNRWAELPAVADLDIAFRETQPIG